MEGRDDFTNFFRNVKRKSADFFKIYYFYLRLRDLLLFLAELFGLDLLLPDFLFCLDDDLVAEGLEFFLGSVVCFLSGSDLAVSSVFCGSVLSGAGFEI